MFRRRRKETQQADAAESAGPEKLLLERVSGLYQAWYFERRAEEEVARGARYKRPFVLVLLEPQLLPGEALDDEVIAKIGSVIRGHIRPTDLAGRLDRTRFAVVLIEADYKIARVVTHRAKLELCQRARVGSGRWRSGIAVFPKDGLEFEALMQVATRRLSEGLAAAA